MLISIDFNRSYGFLFTLKAIICVGKTLFFDSFARGCPLKSLLKLGTCLSYFVKHPEVVYDIFYKSPYYDMSTAPGMLCTNSRIFRGQ